MSARPAEYTQWATDGGAVITEPPLARKEEGWVPLSPPSAAYQNWWMNRVGKWVEYFDTSNLAAPKGWTTVPAETISGGGTTIAFGVGVVLTGGKLYDVPASASFSGLAPSTDYYWSFVVLSGTVEQFTSWDTANAGTNVPLFWAKTSAGSLVTASASAAVAKRVLDLPDSLTLTVSGDAAHRAHFTTLKQAIAAARAIQQGSGLTPRGITIEIIGDVTEPSPLSEPELYGAQRLRFVGRAGGQIGAGAVDARILFNATAGPLFDMASGTPSMVGWSFENLTFHFSGTPVGITAPTVGVLRLLSGSIQTLRFSRCTVLSSGTLPVFLYGGASNIAGLEISNSAIYTSDAMILMASGNLTDLLVDHVTYEWTGSGPGTVFGGIVAPFGEPLNWRIESCKFGKSFSLGGPAVVARELKEGWFINNWFHCIGNSPIIDLGESPTYNDVEMIWIHDNYLRRTANPVSSEPLVRIRSGDDANLGAPIFVHSNAFVGDDPTLSTSAGLLVDSQSPSFLTQVVVHSNSFQRLLYGVVFDGNVSKSVVSSNAMNVKNASVVTDLDQSMLVISGNVMGNSGAAALSLSVDSANTIAVGNYHDGSFLIGANADGIILAASNFGTGGTLTAGIDDVIMLGNRAGSTVTVNAVTDFLAIGNMFYGSNLTLGCSGGILSGNHIEDPLFNPSSGQNIVDGNQFGGAVTLTGNNNSFVCNHVVGAVNISTGDNGIFDSNYLESSLTVAVGANDWVFDGNAIVGVFTYHGASLAAFIPNPSTIGTNKQG